MELRSEAYPKVIAHNGGPDTTTSTAGIVGHVTSRQNGSVLIVTNGCVVIVVGGTMHSEPPTIRRGRVWLPKRPALLAALLVCSLVGPTKAATIAIACSAVGVELELCREAAEAWAARTGHTVRLISTPNDANERLALFQQLLAARSPDIDVVQIDVVWPGILAPYLQDLTPHVPDRELADHFPALVANNRVNGRLVRYRGWTISVCSTSGATS